MQKNDVKINKNSNEIEQFAEPGPSLPQRHLVHASEYSAHIQEAMRYDRLRSSEYPLVMTILDAVLQGHTEEHWQEGQQRILQVLRQQVPEKGAPHADKENRYEQTINRLKDLSLWPW